MRMSQCHLHCLINKPKRSRFRFVPVDALDAVLRGADELGRREQDLDADDLGFARLDAPRIDGRLVQVRTYRVGADASEVVIDAARDDEREFRTEPVGI
jgi:hypothetical protein